MDTSFAQLILNASIIVQLVILLLILASLASWTVIFKKKRTLKNAYYEMNLFEERFWLMDDLSTLFSHIKSGRHQTSNIAKIFEAGFNEFTRLKEKQEIKPETAVERARRAMHIVMNKKIDQLETHISLLATIASISPYIGLFGTVWGIMNSFRALGHAQQATIAMVAPGISEALFATAIGLFAAIPAGIAYNHYTNNIERLANRYDTFIEEFAATLYQHTDTLKSDY